MRAYQRAFAALDTGFGIPNRDFGSNAAFFVLGCACRPCAVNNFAECRNREFVTAVGNDFACQFLNEFRRIGRNRQRAVECRSNMVRIVNFVQVSQRGVNSFKVFLNNSVTFFAVGFLNCILNLRDSFIFRQNVRNSEEAGLHNGVDALTHTGFASNFNSVNGVYFQLFADDFFLNFNRQVIPYFICRVRSVQQESSARFGNL